MVEVNEVIISGSNSTFHPNCLRLLTASLTRPNGIKLGSIL